MQHETKILTSFIIILMLVISLTSLQLSRTSRQPSKVGDFKWPADHQAKDDDRLQQQCDNRTIAKVAEVESLSLDSFLSKHSAIHNRIHIKQISQKTLDFLHSCATQKHQFLLVATVNYAHLTFLKNLVESLAKIGLEKNLVVITLDKRLETALSSRHKHQLPINVLPGTEFAKIPAYNLDASGKEVLWDHRDYNQLVFKKLEIVYSILKQVNRKLVFTDADLVWLQANMLDYFDDLFKTGGFDFIFSRDNSAAFFEMNTGLYAVKPTPLVLKMFELVMDTGLRNQRAFNMIYKTLPSAAKLKFHILPLIYFVNGQTFDEGKLQKYAVKPWTFHANYRMGEAAKIQLLKKAGYWYI